MTRTRRRLATLAVGGAAMSALVLGGAGPAHAVGHGSGTIVVTGGKAYWSWPFNGAPADIRVVDTKADGKCAYVEAYGVAGSGSFDDIFRACPAGTTNARTYVDTRELHVLLWTG